MFMHPLGDILLARFKCRCDILHDFILLIEVTPANSEWIIPVTHFISLSHNRWYDTCTCCSIISLRVTVPHRPHAIPLICSATWLAWRREAHFAQHHTHAVLAIRLHLTGSGHQLSHLLICHHLEPQSLKFEPFGLLGCRSWPRIGRRGACYYITTQHFTICRKFTYSRIIASIRTNLA